MQSTPPGLLLAMVTAWIALAGCSTTDNDGAAPEPAAERARSCGNANYEATRLFQEQDHSNTLLGFKETLELCEDDPPTQYRALTMAADVARQSSEHCRTVRDLFEQVEASREIEFLSASAKLEYACSGTLPPNPYLSELVEALATESYGTDAPAMTEFVRHSQRAQLMLWVGDDLQFVRSRRDATRELCKTDAVLSRVIQALGQSAAGPTNPGSVLGLWTVQPTESIDDASRKCLLRIADELERQAPAFRPYMARDAEQLIVWFRRLER